MLISLLSAVGVTLCIFGYAAFFKINFVNNNESIKIIDFLYGILFLSTISITLNFIIEIKYVSYLIVLLGLFFFFKYQFQNKIKIKYLYLFSIISFLIFISKDNNLAYDSSLYHLQTIKYNYHFKSIFGLANLEPRLGMNSIWHSFISLFYFELFNQNLVYLVNIIIFGLFICLAFELNLNEPTGKHAYYFYILSLIYIFSYSYFHPFNNGTILNSLGSPEVDVMGMIFFIISIYLFLIYLNSKNYFIFQLLIASIFMAIAIKISHIALILLVLYILCFNKALFKVNKFSLFMVFSSLFWILKSFFLSGCLFFPLKNSCFDKSWSLGKSNVEDYRNIISSFNRDISDKQKWTDFDYTLNSSEWFMPWFKNYFLKTELLYISLFVIIFSIVLNSFFLIKNYDLNKKHINKDILFLILTICISTYIWFIAPEIRLGYGTLISLTILFFLILIINLNYDFKKILFFEKILLLFIVLISIDNFKGFNDFNKISFVKNFNYKNFKIIYSINNFNIYKPIQGPFCFDINEFCSYQGFNVNIYKNSNNYFFMENKW